MKPRTTTRRTRPLIIAAAGAALLTLTTGASAASLYWSGGTGTWDDITTANWLDAPVSGSSVVWDNATLDTAVFGDPAGTVTLAEDITAGGLRITHNTYTIAIGAHTLTLGAADNRIILGEADSPNINGTIASAGNFILTGNPIRPARLNLNDTGPGWTGTTTVVLGTTLDVENTSNALVNTSAIAIGGSGTVIINKNGTIGDQVSDTAGITFTGGGRLLQTNTTAGPHTETVGPITVAAGGATIGFTNGASSGGVVLTLPSVTRTPPFTTGVAYAANLTQANLVLTGAVATPANQIIGPWATYGSGHIDQTDYAVYNGSSQIVGAAIGATGEATWINATDAYTVNGGDTLTATRTIAALRADGGAQTLALGANNLETTGLLNGGTGLLTVGGTGALTTPTGGGNLFVTAGTRTGDIAVSAPIIDNGGATTLVINGARNTTSPSDTSNTGSVNVSGTNTHTGGTVVNGGRLEYSNDAHMGAGGSRNVTLSGNGVLRNSSATSTLDTLTVNGGNPTINSRSTTFTSTSGTGTLINGPSTANQTLNLGDASGFTGNLLNDGGTASNARPRTRFSSIADTAGSFITYAGGTGDSNQYQYFELAGDTGPLTFNNRRIRFFAKDRNWSFRDAELLNNNATPANKWVINTDLLNLTDRNCNFLLGGSNTGDNEFAGVIGDSTRGGILYNAPGRVTVQKKDAGKWILSGPNTYTGNTTIVNGTLEIRGSGTYANITSTDATPNPLLINTAGTPTITGTVSGTMGLTKDGAGTLTVTGALSQSGGTTVSNGTLSLGDGTNNAGLSDIAELSTVTTAKVDLNYVGTDVVLNLRIDGALEPAGVYNVGNRPGAFTGTGSITSLGGDTSSINLAFWDGGLTGGTGDAVSDGGTGTWDLATLNWDVGPVARTTWLNTTADTANFNGARGTVTLGADMNIGIMNIEVPDAGGSGYFIGDAAEDNTLTFGGDKEINITPTGGNTSHRHTIRAGIAGSPTVRVAMPNRNDGWLDLRPTANVTMTLGQIDVYKIYGRNGTLYLGGQSNGNVADEVIWGSNINSGHQLFLRKRDATNGGPDGSSWTINQDINLSIPSGGYGGDGRIYVEEGTLIFSGTNNQLSHSFWVQDGGRAVVQGNWRMNREDEDFRVESGGIVAPGASVGTVTFNWDDNAGSTGQVDLQDGSTYEWEVGAASTDVIAITKPTSGSSELVVGTGTTDVIIKVIDAGGSPSAGDKLTVFTCESGVVYPNVTTLTNNTTIDLTGTTWTGTPSWVIDVDGAGDATISIIGISSGGGGSPYDDWADDNGLDGTAGKEDGPADDPDMGGKNNLFEFGFNGDPLDASDEGLLFELVADSDADGDSDPELLLTAAVRKTASFTAGAPATSVPAVDGIVYTISGGTSLPIDGAVTVNVATTPVVPAGAPDLTGTDYRYVTFSLAGSTAAGVGFLQATVAPE